MKATNKGKALTWYELQGFVLLLLLVAIPFGGGILSSILYLAAVVMIIISLVEAIRGGNKGSRNETKPSTGGRIGAFLLALVLGFILLGTYTQIEKAIQASNTPNTLEVQ